jgi:hypothetical protein
VEQLQHFVEGGGVARTAGDDRVDALEVAGDQVALEDRLTRVHPVPVAAQRVDLAVVGDVAVRVRERPRRERVGGEAGVHEADGAGDAFIGQVVEELFDLRLGEHSFVDDRPRRQAGEVDLVFNQFVLGPFADAERGPLQGETVGAGAFGASRGEDELGEMRHRRRGRRADVLGVHGKLAPAEYSHVLLGGDPLDGGHGAATSLLVNRQESRTDCVGAGFGQAEVHDFAVERVRNLEQDAGTVAGLRFGAPGASVFEVAQCDQRLAHDAVISPSGEVGDEGNAAGVVLKLFVVQALPGSWCVAGHGWPPPKGVGESEFTRSWGLERPR